MTTTTIPINGGGDPRLAAQSIPGRDDPPPLHIKRELEDRQRKQRFEWMAREYPELAPLMNRLANGEPLPDALAATELDEPSEDALLRERLGSAWRWCARGCRAALDWCCAHSAAIAWSFAVAFLVATAALGSDPAARITMLACHGMALVGLGLLVFREPSHG